MSDTGRKGVGEQLKEKATPQDQKVCYSMIEIDSSPTPNKPLRQSRAHMTVLLLPLSLKRTSRQLSLLPIRSVAAQTARPTKAEVSLIRPRTPPTISWVEATPAHEMSRFLLGWS